VCHLALIWVTVGIGSLRVMPERILGASEIGAAKDALCLGA